MLSLIVSSTLALVEYLSVFWRFWSMNIIVLSHDVRKRTLDTLSMDWLHSFVLSPTPLFFLFPSISPIDRWNTNNRTFSLASYSRFLVRHHWFVLSSVVLIAIVLTVIGLVCKDLPDFSDPRKVKHWSKGHRSSFDATLLGMGCTGERDDLFTIDGSKACFGEISSCLRTPFGQLRVIRRIW